MPGVPAFHSVDEAAKAVGLRAHHNNGACSPGQRIPEDDRRAGPGGYRLCQTCHRLNQRGR
jgi:hypothetical protein